MIAWNPCVDLHAPRDHQPEVREPEGDDRHRPDGRERRRATVSGMPASGRERQEEQRPAATASVVPPSACPSTMLRRSTGATSTPCRKPELPVLDHRDRRKDRREEQHERDRPREEVLEVAQFRRRARRPERRGEAAAEQDPEDDRLHERADDAAPLAEEADDLAPPEGRDRQHRSGLRLRRRRGAGPSAARTRPRASACRT